MVIICHVQLPSELSRYSKALARFAVPYFMMVTGWYIWRKDNEEVITYLSHAGDHHAGIGACFCRTS